MSDPNLIMQRQIQELQATLEVLRKADTAMYTTGTFTPTFSGSATAGAWTYSTQAGFYTQIGNRIFFNLSIAAATRTSVPSGDAWIVGLPTNSNATANSHSAVCVDTISGFTLTGTIVQLTARVPPSATRVELVENIGTAPSAASLLAATAIGATAFIRVSGTYLL